ncbi:MAG TPA: hypothetical protein VFO83_03745, partial [Aggregicoccus sp.]|nr:hypothetical protein [Aggregicoccus sp.]
VVPVYPPVMYAPQAAAAPAPARRTKRVTAPKAAACPPGTAPAGAPVTAATTGAMAKAPAGEAAKVCAPEPAKVTTVAAPAAKAAPATGGSGD